MAVLVMVRMIVIRATIIIMMPLIIAWVAIERTFREMKSIPFYVWCDICEACDTARNFWRDAGAG